MPLDATKLFKPLFAALIVGLFALAIAAPATVDTGSVTMKSAFAAKGSGKDGADDGTADQGGGNNDDAPDAPDGAGDDGTADQGPGDA